MALTNFNKVYYGLSQYLHGAEHRFIYSEDKLKELLLKEEIISRLDSEILELDGEDIGFPFGGSNSSATWFSQITNTKEAEEFLSAEAVTEYEDPMLCDVAEYYLRIETEDKDLSTLEVLNALGKTVEDYDKAHCEEYLKAEGFIAQLGNSGYQDFDYENPFYGKDSDMRMSELEGLVLKQMAKQSEYNEPDIDR